MSKTIRKYDLANMIYKSENLTLKEKVYYVKELRAINGNKLVEWVNNKVLKEQLNILDQIIDDIISKIRDVDYEYSEDQEPIVKRSAPPASEL
jgi:hypothetical protein